MQVVSESFNLLWAALFLQPEPYISIRDQKNPAGKGLVILILLGLLLALATFIGSLLTWASSPDLAAVQDAVLSNLQQMNWWMYVDRDPEVRAIWFQIWDSIWAGMRFFNPTPASGLAGFIFKPLGLIVSWIVFGLVVHLLALLFGGRGRLSQTLGTTSLAAAPELLGIFAVLPFVTLAGVGIWVMLARYMAVRVTHDLSWARTVWVIVLAMLAIFILKVLLIGTGALAIGSTMAAVFGGG